MLHQISWFNYGSAVVLIAIIYYGYLGLTFYKAELQAAFYRLSGKKLTATPTSGGDFQLPNYGIAGASKAEEVDFVAQEELTFGPAEDIAPQNSPDLHLVGDFSEMISEVKTLIRVINESSESKENFEMLFRLIVQKYPELTGTVYEDQVNDYLINEGSDEFPFSLTFTELKNYWMNPNQPAQ